MKQKIRKVVIPAAGFGTRFLPATKAMPKEILPVVDKPIIQFVVEEAVAAGIEDVILVTGWHKRIIEDHFDYPYELEKRLEAAGKKEQLKEIRRIASLANFIYMRQKGPQGTATAVLSARPAVGDEPFMVLWGDEFFDAQPTRAEQLIKIWEKYKSPVIPVLESRDRKDADSYGIVYGKEVEEGVYRVEKLVEKPGAKNVKLPLLISISGFIFTPEIFDILKKQKPGKNGEIWLADAIRELARRRPVYAYKLKNAVYCDTGNKLEYIKTIIHFAMKRKEYRTELVTYLKRILEKEN